MIKFRIMEIWREKELFLELDNQKFIINPLNLKEKEDSSLILTKYQQNFNFGRIFASPGEYNIGSILIYGFINDNDLWYYFESEEGKIILSEKLDDNLVKEIKNYSDELDGLIFLGSNFDTIFSKKLKLKNIFTTKEINLSNYEKVMGKRFKLNLKRSINRLYILT